MYAEDTQLFVLNRDFSTLAGCVDQGLASLAAPSGARMFKSVKHFVGLWKRESANTAKVFGTLTDASLSQRIAPGYRSLGELAWHIASSVGHIAWKTGLKFPAPDDKVPPPGRAAEILTAYAEAAGALAREIQANWTDATLDVKDRMYGADLPRGFTLELIVFHEIHHRGQMTVLMR